VFEIPQDPLDCRPMGAGWTMQILSDFVDSKCNVRPCEGEILKGTNDATIFGGIFCS
jgi:hypothetical protein